MQTDVKRFTIKTKDGLVVLPEEILLSTGEKISSTESYQLTSNGAQWLQVHQGVVINSVIEQKDDNDFVIGKFPEGFYKFSVKELLGIHKEAIKPAKEKTEEPIKEEGPGTYENPPETEKAETKEPEEAEVKEPVKPKTTKKKTTTKK